MPPEELHQRFTTLLEQYQGILFKIARSYCPDKSERADLIQDMMLQVWRSLPDYNERFAKSTWMYRICLNTAISHYRKSKTRHKHIVLFNDAPDLPDTSSAATADSPSALLEAFIAQLKEFDKALIILYLEGTPQKEIAEIMGMTIANVSTRIGRIKESLKKKLTQENNHHDRS